MASTLASGTRVRLSYVAESTMGTTPGSPTMKTLRAVGRNINLEKNILTSKEVRQDRQLSDLRHGFNKVAGDIQFELSLSAYDDFLAAALGGTWAAVPDVVNADGVAVASTTTFTRTGGSFLTDGYRPGDLVKGAAWSNSANNVTMRVTAVVALTLTVEGPLVVEAAASGKKVTFPGKRLDVGTTLTTFSIERAFLDITQYEVHKGVAVNTCSIDVKPEQIVGGRFGLVGMQTAAMSGSSLGSPTAAPTNSPFDAFDGDVFEGGAAIGICTGFDVQIDNGRNVQAVVGTPYSPEVFEGTAKITGNAMVFFKDATMFNKFVNETESSIYCRLDDINGTDFMNIVVPRLKYTGAMKDPPQEGPIVQNMPFSGLVSSVTGTSLSIQRSNVS